MYHQRHTVEKLIELSQHFKVVLVKGARQVGKSTLLQHTFPDTRCIVLDATQDLFGAKSDPDLFLDNFPSPLILDEIQYAPALLSAIKRRVDLSETPGQYFLTGSQNLSVLQSISESLAGRVGILHLQGMTPQELANQVIAKPKKTVSASWLPLYLDNPASLLAYSNNTAPIEQHSLYEAIWRGCLPGLMHKPNHIAPPYLSAYIETYIERDVRLLENIKDLSQFSRFVGLAAALSAQEINYSQLGRDIGITPTTATNWLNVLNHTFQWRELYPYSGNSIKRVSKKRKGYMTDTGLCCYLQRITTPESLSSHPSLGALFETWVVNLICQLSAALDTPPVLYHWRSNGGAEVDIILERDGCLYPIEVKCKSVLKKSDARGIKAFRQSYAHQKIMPALIVYAGKTCYFLDKDIIALPWNS